MSARTVLPSQRLRIAIGLTALKFKPSEQSIQSYTLELKHHFRHSAPSSGSEEYDAWRDRVLALEAELETTRAAASASRAEVRRLHICTAEPSPEPTTSASKKKSKPPKKSCRTSDPKKALLLGVCPHSQGRPQGPREKHPSPARVVRSPACCAGGVTDYMRTLAGLPSPINNGLFSSLHALDAVSTVKANSPPDTALVVAATIRCVEVLHGLLARATSPAPDMHQDPTPHETLSGIERTLPHVLRTAISTLDGADIDPSSAACLRWHTDPTGDDDPTQRHPNDTISALDLVLGRVATSLLVPAIRAIVPCTLPRQSVFSRRPPAGEENPQTRQTCWASSVPRSKLCLIPHISQYTPCCPRSVRALTSLVAERQREAPSAQRIHRIARKDALHFLCDAVLLSLRRNVPVVVPPGGAGEMLSSALEAALGELALTLSAREGKSGLDAVEELRMLVVLERAWSVGRRVGNIGGDEGGNERMDASQGVDVTMTDVDGEDREGGDQRRGSDTELMADGS
ncbi:hypothetical protein EI94DRAFT_1810924 [Lactarius quietus]|nr:hypothetical protein EI94DRAFT_1810924 [Lactarius quietus]